MSIQSVHSNEHNEEGVGLKMTIGTSIEISNSVISPTADTVKSDKCFALPYQDHDYGAPSINDFIIVPEKGVDTFDSFQNDKSINLSASNLPQTKSNGFADIDSNSCQSAATDYSDLDITRCICGFEHDDGYMICCDRCSVWQHIDCMQIDRNAIPETYLCEQCQPREVNQEYATKLQTNKKEEFLAHDTDSGTEDEKLKDVPTYTAVQSTPTSMTITSNRHKRGVGSTLKKRKRSADSQLNHKKIIRDGKKRAHPRIRSKSLMSSEEESAWLQEIRKWEHNYATKESNTYSDELRSAVNDYPFDPYKEDSILQKLTVQLAKVQQLRDALLAIEDISSGQSLIEYNGSFMLSKTFKESGNDFTKKPYPYVLFYNALDGMQICVDSRSQGNIARFIRRSCSPNAEVQHCFDKGELRLFLISKTDISKDAEVTIPFDFNYEDCSYPVSCCCSKGKSCSINIAAYKKYFRLNKHKANFPSNFPLNGIHVNGYGSSDDLTEGDEFQNRKKSREERKMESYIRAFKELEKKEKRKCLMQQHSNDVKLATPVPALVRPTTAVHDTSVITETTVSDTVTSTAVATVVNTTTVMSTSVVTPTVAPAKCHTRRRSSRVRRVSKKLQTGFVDDEHCSKLISNDILNKSLSPAIISSSESQQPTTSTVVCSTVVSALSSTSYLPDLLTVTSSQQPVKDEKILDKKTADSDENVIQNNDEELLNEDEMLNDANNAQDCVYKSNANTSLFSSTWQSQTTAVSSSETSKASISLKLIKSCSKQSKRPSSTVDWISTRPTTPVLTGRPRSASISVPKSTESSAPTSTATTAPTNTKASLPVLNCNVVKWDFQPGVPNGMVRINACPFNKPRLSTYSKPSCIKKRWLKQIEEEEALRLLKCDKCSLKDCDGNCKKRASEIAYDSLPIKKRKLLGGLECNSTTTATIFNENTIEIDEDIAVLSSEDIQNELGTSNCTEFPENLHKFDIHNLMLEAKTPTIEIASEELTHTPLVNLQPPHSNEEVASEAVNSLEPIEYNEQPPSAVKRKVSLQEYLKRSKPKKEKPTLKAVDETKDIASIDATSETSAESEKSSKVDENVPTSKSTTVIATQENKTHTNSIIKPTQETKQHSVEETKNLKGTSEAEKLNDKNLNSKSQNQSPREFSYDTKPVNHHPVPTVTSTHKIIQTNIHADAKKNIQQPKKEKNSDSHASKTNDPVVHNADPVMSSPMDTTPRHEPRSDSSMEPTTPVVISPIRPPSQIRSRHNSSASSSSSKSPQVVQDQFTPKSSGKNLPISRTTGRRNNSGRHWHDSNNFRRKSPPRKVPSLTPAVPGQPIPSLMRTGDGRGPQRIYNRESPRRNVRSPSPDHWRHPPHVGFSQEPKYHQPPSNVPWRRREFDSGCYRRDSYGNYPPNPRPYFRQNSDQGSDNPPYSPKQFYRHDNGPPNYHHNSYNDHPPPFHKPHSNPPRSYSPNTYSPNNNRFEPPYTHPHYS